MARALPEERLGQLLRIVPPAPAGWVRAAQELPGVRGSLDEIVARVEADLEFRAALISDLETALGQAGYEPGERLLEAVRRRLIEG
jgi:hypothetical protein